MLYSAHNIPCFTDAVLFPRSGPGLYAMLASAGHSREVSQGYDFHGLKRGDRGILLFQYTLAGEGELRFEDRTHRLRQGEAMLLSIPHDHRYRLPAHSPFWEFIYLCLTGREALRLGGELIAQRGPVWALQETDRPVQEAFAVCGNLSEGAITNQYQASSMAYSFLMALAEEILPGGGRVTLPEWVNAVSRFCHEEYQREIGVDEMAEVSGYSRYHFSRLFRRWMGCSPGEYLQGVRLNEATRSLTRSDLSVKQVAHQSGFHDYNYFCRAFRRAYGQSPGAFRRSGLI